MSDAQHFTGWRPLEATDLFYAIYSPSKKSWRECVRLEGDERWVGPIDEGEEP